MFNTSDLAQLAGASKTLRDEILEILALEDMIAKRDKLTLPLKSHGYLLEIIAGQAGKAEAAAETGKETAARGVTPVGTHASHKKIGASKQERSSPEAVKAGLEQVRSALKKGGNTDGHDA